MIIPELESVRVVRSYINLRRSDKRLDLRQLEERCAAEGRSECLKEVTVIYLTRDRSAERLRPKLGAPDGAKAPSATTADSKPH